MRLPLKEKVLLGLLHKKSPVFILVKRGSLLLKCYTYHEKERNVQGDTKKIDGGEIPMPCFVAKELHGKKTAHRAAKQRGEKQRFFGNAPTAASCLVLIRTVEHKRHKGHGGNEQEIIAHVDQ